MRQVALKIRNTQSAFELLTDEDLIEACIYQLGSLETNYRHLIKQAKQRYAANQAPPKEEKGQDEQLDSMVPIGGTGPDYGVVLQTQQKTG